jgi:hypothetical protein
MTNYRCARCELLRDEGDFSGEIYCKVCEKNNADYDNQNFRIIFDLLCKEIFCLRYPDEPHDNLSGWVAINIPSDYWKRKELIQTKKQEIEKKIKFWEKTKKDEIENIESCRKRKEFGVDVSNVEIEYSNRMIKEATSFIKHLEVQQPKILQLEQRYNQ